MRISLVKPEKISFLPLFERLETKFMRQLLSDFICDFKSEI